MSSSSVAGAVTNRQTYGIRLGPAHDRDAVIAAMREANIECGRLSYALAELPSLSRARHAGQAVAESLVREAIALPLHTQMNEADVKRVVEALAGALGL